MLSTRWRNEVKVPSSFSPTFLREGSILPGREINAVYEGTSKMQLVRRLSRFEAGEERRGGSLHLRPSQLLNEGRYHRGDRIDADADADRRQTGWFAVNAGWAGQKVSLGP